MVECERGWEDNLKTLLGLHLMLTRSDKQSRITAVSSCKRKIIGLKGVKIVKKSSVIFYYFPQTIVAPPQVKIPL